MPETRSTAKYMTPLREAQRDLTRGRIKDAARDLFYKYHYDATTMDEIAEAAGTRRSTLYLHYKDKAEILADVIADYTPNARNILATLQGPNPTRQQLQRWIKEVASFVAKERVQLSIISELRRNRAHGVALGNLTQQLLAGLGENNPPFRVAATDKAEPMLRARALLLLQELTYTCEVYLDDTDSTFGKALQAWLDDARVGPDPRFERAKRLEQPAINSLPRTMSSFSASSSISDSTPCNREIDCGSTRPHSASFPSIWLPRPVRRPTKRSRTPWITNRCCCSSHLVAMKR